MAGLGPTELIIILVIVLVLFGVGRLARLGGELGAGVRELKKELGADEKQAPPEQEK
jgi:sec-independent protein translocase protein TatA